MRSWSFKLFRTVFEIIFIIYLLTAILGFIFISYQSFNTEFETSLLINTDLRIGSPDFSIDLISENKSINNPKLKVEQWNLSIQTKSGLVKWSLSTITLVALIYMGFLLFYFRKIIQSLKMGSPFTRDNYWRLKVIAYMVMAIDPIVWIFKLIYRNWVINNFNFKDDLLFYSFENYFHIGFTNALWNSVVLGLLILIIAEVFGQGIKMKEEQELTI